MAIWMSVERFKDQFLPRLAGLARLYGSCGVVLFADIRLPEGRGVWIDVAVPSGRSIGSGQHRGRSWAGERTHLCSISPHCARITERVGDALAACGKRWHREQSAYRSCNATMRGLGKNAARADSLTTAEICSQLTFPAIRHSLLAIRA